MLFVQGLNCNLKLFDPIFLKFSNLENNENSEEKSTKMSKQYDPPRVLRAARVVLKLVLAEEEKGSSFNNQRYFMAQNRD